MNRVALLIVLPVELKSDALLVRQFGDHYLACISGTLKKSELYSLAFAYSELVQVEGSRRFFGVPSYVVEERLRQTPFTEDEVNELTRLQSKNISIIDAFIQNKSEKIKRELMRLPDILKRNMDSIWR